jgi:hypothetical protein
MLSARWIAVHKTSNFTYGCTDVILHAAITWNAEARLKESVDVIE